MRPRRYSGKGKGDVNRHAGALNALKGGIRMPQQSHAIPLASVDRLHWFDCRVHSVGPGEDGTIWVNLTATNGEFTEVWFIALPAIRQQVLETALAALQSNLRCQVGLTGKAANSEIYRIHAIAQ